MLQGGHFLIELNMQYEPTKPINLDNSKSWDYHKKITLAGKTVIVEGKRYEILSFISGKSFRRLNGEDKKRIGDKLKGKIKNEVNRDLVNFLFDKRLVVKLKFFLNSPYYNKVDVDNITKTILDCLHGIAYKNDRQINHIEATKIRVNKGDSGGIYVRISEWLTIKRIYN